MLKAGFFLRVVEVYEQYCRPIVSNIDEITIRISGTGILFEGSVGPDRYIVILPYNKCHIQIRIFQKNCTPSFKNTIGFHRVHMQSICNQGSDHSERTKQTMRDRKNEDNHVSVFCIIGANYTERAVAVRHLGCTDWRAWSGHSRTVVCGRSLCVRCR